MREIGEYLKNKRIELGISLEEAEQFLKIRKKYIVAIEEGDESVLPGKTYFVGYLRNYANFLQADQNYINQLLDQTEQVPRTVDSEPQIKIKKRNRYFKQKKTKTTIKKEKKPINIIPMLRFILVIFLIIGFVFTINQFIQRLRVPYATTAENKTNTQEKIIEQEMLEIAKENSEIEENNEEDFNVFLPPLPDYEPVEITADETSWIKISQGDKVLFEDMIIKGEKIIVKSDALITLITPSPNKIIVSYKGNNIEPQLMEDNFLLSYRIVPSNN